MSDSVMKRFVVRFEGRVQGVGFRVMCISEAAGLTVHGFVRNEQDGSVLLDVDATNQDGNELIRRIRANRKQQIVNCQVSETDSLGRESGFSIRH